MCMWSANLTRESRILNGEKTVTSVYMALGKWDLRM